MTEDQYEHIGGSGIWTNLKNKRTGEESVKLHEPKVVWRSCRHDEHDYKITGNRELTCTKCKHIREFRVGIDDLKKLGI